MPTYNRASYVGAALDSLMSQTTAPGEVLVIDDRSVDDTRARVEAHPLAGRIRYHLQPENRGASVARNVGVEMARGDIVVFLDSDDLLTPQHHAHVLRAFDTRPSLGLYCCDAKMIGPNGESLGADTWTTTQCRIKQWMIATGLRSLTDIFLFSTPFPGLAVRREVYRDVGGLAQDLFPLDDFDLQLKVAATNRDVYYEHLPLARYRVHGDNESGAARAVRVGRQKLRCIEQARTQHAELRALGARARRRVGEARRELAFALLREGVVLAGLGAMARSLVEDPPGAREVLRVAARRLRRLSRRN
jgi:glycosyltransferase involved in cell wall biosynthesis